MSFFLSSRSRYAFVVLTIGFFLVGAWLPSATRGVFASPDETAAAVIAETIPKQGNAILPEPLATRVPWLHPRSWISAGDTIAPVGFLGWPLLVSPLVWLFGTSVLPWVGLLLVLSSMYPVFRLLSRRFSEAEAMMGIALLFFFPSILLYANRGLFANLPQLALLAWWAFFMRPQRAEDRASKCGFVQTGTEILGGVLAALIILFRPIEGIWLLPWMWWWAQKTAWTRKRLLLELGGAVPVVCLYGLIVYRTYGDVFAIGYLLRDNPLPLLGGSLSSSVSALRIAFSWHDVLPYGFHPRHIWWNISSFTREILWPWLLALFGVWLPIGVRKAKVFSQGGGRAIVWRRVTTLFTAPVILSIWTVCVLLVMYGSGLYADHIRPGAITIANSFLRYTLPLVPLWLYLFLRGMEHHAHSIRGRLGLRFLVALLLGVSLFTVFIKDDEGLIATRAELKRYTRIREAATTLFPSGSIILSDRSDKIFFPVLRAVSPLPVLFERARVTALAGVTIGLFVRPLSQADRDAWRAAGVVPQELESFGRERFYRLMPLAP